MTRSNVGKPRWWLPAPGATVPRIPRSDLQFIDGGVWRYHPMKD
jgi:hypothetical protein